MMSVLLTKTYDFSGDAWDLCARFRDEPHLFCLESGRYSLIGFAPFEVFQGKGRDTLRALKDRYSSYRGQGRQTVTPFAGGIVGYLGYDYGLYQEKIKPRAKDDLKLPDAVFGFYDRVLTVDHHTRKLHVTSSGWPEKNKASREKRAAARLEEIERALKRGTQYLIPDELSIVSPFKSNFTKDEYLATVRKVLDHIAAGDIYQLNLSQRFTYDMAGESVDPLEIYRVLRQLSPVSSGGYFDAGALKLISNSPEMFLRLRDGKVQTRPMKGTRPRGLGLSEDRRLREEIEQSAKDQAELLMVTDLERNDLGKVCDYGSVRVKEMRAVEEYKYVFQATSTVEGALRRGKDCFDLIEACFPGGSITGCPKIRAMEIIEELEPVRRGPYTGSMGYIDFAGNMDLNILIRTLIHCGQKIHFQVGGGIVADSTPEGEYEETLVKAGALRMCLEKQRNYAQTDHLARR
ncbi:MAG TPA: aminodeoxychorismate synthase component I [Candidatus Omnitrophica bacterium]|nr:MAG: aminodeoxychorismate synthase, component I [Omnitrophica WOR_2 bacterium GWA2_53_43]HCI44979.1 aminodeoxychorismate synthase component I [Candidatus Omnitrophota bacterium]